MINVKQGITLDISGIAEVDVGFCQSETLPGLISDRKVEDLGRTVEGSDPDATVGGGSVGRLTGGCLRYYQTARRKRS